MKVLITGATGFVGSHLAEMLIERGYDVRALVRKTSNRSSIEKLKLEVVSGDLTDTLSIEEAVKGCRQIYHLAALTGRLRHSRKQYHSVNITGTENVVRAALKFNVERLVHVSTAGIYGTIKDPPVNENMKPNPNSLYRETKLLSERVALDYHRKDSLPVVIARIGSVFGPGSLNWLDLFRSIAGKRFRIIGDGDNHVHLGYVSDIIDGIRRCGEVEGIEGEAYLIAGKEPACIKTLTNMIGQELNVEITGHRSPSSPFSAFNGLAQFVYRRFGFELPYSHRYEFFLSDNIFDISKAKRELSYNPTISLNTGIQQTVRWYRESGYI